MEPTDGASNVPWNDSHGYYVLQTNGVSPKGAGEFLRGDDVSDANDQKRLEDVDRNDYLKDSCGPQSSLQSANFEPSQITFETQ
jgi:hypothetical protein